jgi:hypothetical protein
MESVLAQNAVDRNRRTEIRPYAPVRDNPALPRVLLIGDSISIGLFLPVRAA